jgi:hypothetical protein
MKTDTTKGEGEMCYGPIPAYTPELYERLVQRKVYIERRKERAHNNRHLAEAFVKWSQR